MTEKRFFPIALIFFLGIFHLGFSSRAEAGRNENEHHNKLAPSLGPYMTDNGSTAPKPSQTFKWAETPYVFLSFDGLSRNNGGKEKKDDKKPIFLQWEWRHSGDPAPVVKENNRFSPSEDGSVNIWRPMGGWDNRKKTGEWTVKTKWHFEGAGEGADWHTTNFTVTPEPLSTILFLSGGAALMTARRLRHHPSSRRKQ